MSISHKPRVTIQGWSNIWRWDRGGPRKKPVPVCAKSLLGGTKAGEHLSGPPSVRASFKWFLSGRKRLPATTSYLFFFSFFNFLFSFRLFWGAFLLSFSPLLFSFIALSSLSFFYGTAILKAWRQFYPDTLSLFPSKHISHVSPRTSKNNMPDQGEMSICCPIGRPLLQVSGPLPPNSSSKGDTFQNGERNMWRVLGADECGCRTDLLGGSRSG